MAKGYWIGNSDVTDPAGMTPYREANQSALKRHHARFVIKGGSQEVVEGPARSRVTVVEFPSYADALACYNDPEYQDAVKFRHASAEGTMIIVEGFDDPQS